MSQREEPDPEPLWDIQDVCRFLKVEHKYIRRHLIETNAVSHFLIGGRYRFERQEILSWLEQQRSVPKKRPRAIKNEGAA